jgi:hypothetical protein
MEVGVERSSGERWRRGLEGFGVALEAVGPAGVGRLDRLHQGAPDGAEDRRLYAKRPFREHHA